MAKSEAVGYIIRPCDGSSKFFIDTGDSIDSVYLMKKENGWVVGDMVYEEDILLRGTNKKCRKCGNEMFFNKQTEEMYCPLNHV